jgi:competence protein ComEC
VNYGELRAQESLSVPSVFDGGLFIPFEKARRFLSLTATQRVAGEAGAMTAALLTGGQSALSAPVMEMMRDSGLSHLLSISGLHVGMIICF